MNLISFIFYKGGTDYEQSKFTRLKKLFIDYDWLAINTLQLY